MLRTILIVLRYYCELVRCNELTFVLISQVANESTPLVISRVVLSEFATILPKLGDDQHVKIAQIAIEKIQPRVVAFEDQISVIRENLSKVFEENEQWVDAAKILIGIPLESGQRCVSEPFWPTFEQLKNSWPLVDTTEPTSLA